LLEISYSLYTPDSIQKPSRFEVEDWIDVSSWGGIIQCCSNTSKFISNLNVSNIRKYEEYRNSQFKKSFQENDVSFVLQIINDLYITRIEIFEKVFRFAEQHLEGGQHDLSWELLYRLLKRSEADICSQYLENQISEEKNFLRICRLKHLKDVLDEQEYYQTEMEAQAARESEEQTD
jgi:hypothetical protein